MSLQLLFIFLFSFSPCLPSHSSLLFPLSLSSFICQVNHSLSNAYSPPVREGETETEKEREKVSERERERENNVSAGEGNGQVLLLDTLAVGTSSGDSSCHAFQDLRNNGVKITFLHLPGNCRNVRSPTTRLLSSVTAH